MTGSMALITPELLSKMSKTGLMNEKIKSLSVIVLAFVLIAFIIVMLTGVPDGREVFKREGCSGCHSLRGHGGGIGPDLTAVSKEKGYFWISRQIRNPSSHNPDSRMPAYTHLSSKEIRALIKYLKEADKSD